MNTRNLHRLIGSEIEPQKIKVDEIKAIMKVNKDEGDLINFNENCSFTSERSREIDKNKQIADYQMKMLEEFLKTTGNKSQNKSTMTPEQNVQFKKFFDEYESKQKINDHTLTKPLNTSTQSANNIIVIGNPTILIPKLKEERDFNINKNFIDELISGTNSMSKLNIASNHTKLKHDENSTRDDSKPNKIDKELDDFRSMMSEIMAKNDLPYAALSLDKKAFTKETDPNKSSQNCFEATVNDTTKGSNAYINDLVNKNNIRYLEAVKKDDKKRCELVTDAEKVNLTPGPALQEKSMFLPQIMQRLAKRKEALDKSTLVSKAVNVNKTVKEFESGARLSKAANKNFANLLELPKYPMDTNINGHKDPKYTNNIFKPTADNKNIDYPPVENLRVLRKGLKELAELQNSNSEENLRVLKPPEVLMENCNKQRYKAHAASRLFEDFIKSG